MIRTVGLGLLVVLLVTQHHARGFSRVAVAHQKGRLRSRLAVVARQKVSDAAWSSVSFSGQEVMSTRSFADDEAQAAAKRQYDTNIFIVALIPPIIAFISYGDVAHALAYVFDLMGFNGSNVDGNSFATNLLRPTINGVVGEYGTVRD